MPDYLRIVGPFHAPTGYSHMTRAALRMALLAGYTVQAVESDTRVQFVQYTDGRMERTDVIPPVKEKLPDCQWDEVEKALAAEIPDDSPTLLIQLPMALNRRCHFAGGPKIGWTMGESDRICKDWSGGCRGVDTLWVPSNWCGAAFAAGLPASASVRVMPIPVDERIFCPEGPVMPVRDRPPFVFASVFATSERKFWRLLMQAFVEEFGYTDNPQAALVMKPSRVAEVDQLADWCRQTGAKVGTLGQMLSDYDIAALYRACDCVVQPSPEGFGLPYVEAAMCGRPSIALDRGGAADVVDEETGYIIRSKMDRIMGHLPSVYLPDHRFPVPTLQGIRKALRRAVSDPKIKQKSALAKERAQAFTPAALASRFREEIDRAVHRRFCNPPRQHTYSPSRTGPQYGLALGAWGDAFCSFGMALKMRDPNRPLRMIQFGRDAAIADFLREQPELDGVVCIRPESQQDFLDVWHLASCSRFGYRDEWLPAFAGRAGVDPRDVLFSQINQAEDQPVCRWHDATLPAGLRCWAHTNHRIWGDYICLHPISTQSAFRSEHWPHWEDAIRWLLDETPHTYVLTGTADMDLPDHERLINLLCRTPSMMHVLALCEKAAGVISTCNAVAHWTVIQRIPGLICANGVFDWKQDYYHRFTNAEPNTMLYRYDTLEWFETTARGWLAERFPDESTVESRESTEEAVPA